MKNIDNFEDLECYKLARELRMKISLLCKQFPREEEYRLKDQIIRASRSVAANIAEGFGRHSHQENAQFCRQARGSLSETLEHTNCALDERYISKAEYTSIRELIAKTWRTLNGYILYLTKCAKQGVPNV